MTTSSDSIVAVVAHAREVPASERHRFAAGIRTEPNGGGLLLETCHRVEFYAARDTDVRRRMAAVVPSGARAFRGEAAIRHALTVAVGRDSVVVGEDQVLHQLRQAFETVRTAGTLDPVLERLFSTALRAGRTARSWRQDPPRSLADLAVDLIERHAGPLGGRDLLVVGAGNMGRLAVRAGARAGAGVAVASRSSSSAAELAHSAGTRLESFDPGGRAGTFAGIVVALGGPWPVGAEALESLGRAPTFVVDLSVPPAVPQSLATILGRRLATADDFARLDPAVDPAPARTLARLDDLIERAVDDFVTWLDGRERRDAAHALVARADRERETELAELWRRLPDLDVETRATIEGMSRHLAERLLREPLERLGADADGRHERAIRELWAL